MKKRLFASLLCLALCLSLLPITALADGDGGVAYIERGWDGSAVTEQVETIDTYTPIVENTVTWKGSTTGGWYVARDNVTINQRVQVQGNVYLILTDGCTLTVNGGIQLKAGNSLTIYGQSEQAGTMGRLIASITEEDASIYDAVIGGNGSDTGGNDGGAVTIHGGFVSATATIFNHNANAGTGNTDGTGDTDGTDGTGGNDDASIGSAYGAAIGGGGGNVNGGDGGTITIYGGVVEAINTVDHEDEDNNARVGTAYGAAIGGGGGGGKIDNKWYAGIGGDGGTVIIYGGAVEASTVSGAAIGGGCGDAARADDTGGTGGEGGSITIYGGTVEAESVTGAGMGGGGGTNVGGDGGSITIHGGSVKAASYSGAAIGGGGNRGTMFGFIPTEVAGSGGTITINGGSVEASSCTGAAIGGGGSRYAYGGDGGTITINGGTVTAIAVPGSVEEMGAVGCGAAIGGGASVANGGDGGTITINGGFVSATVTEEAAPDVDPSKVLQYGAAIGGSSGIIAGSGGTITINGGIVEASSPGGAAIGGGEGGGSGAGGDGGSITIHGGSVTAASTLGAAIGGGGGHGNRTDNKETDDGSDTEEDSSMCRGGTITINGGTVDARSQYGAGIGGGALDIAWADKSNIYTNLSTEVTFTGGDGGTITIRGGTVSAASDRGAAIGGGSTQATIGKNVTVSASNEFQRFIVKSGDGGTVTISGGTVSAESAEGAAIGSGGMPVYQSASPDIDSYFTYSGGDIGTFATGSDGSAALFATGSGAGNHIQDNDDPSGWSGVIFLDGEGQLYGTSVTLSEDVTIPSGNTLEIGQGQTLSVGQGVTMTIDNEDCLTGGGTLGAGGSYEILNPLPVFTPTTLFYTGSDLSGRLSLTAPAGSVSIMGQIFTVSGTPTYRDWVITLPAGGILQVGTYTVTAYSPSQGRTVSGQITVIGDSSSTPTYSVILPGRVEGGTVTAKKSYAEEGETFRFTVTPDEGWELDTLSVTDNRGTELDVKYEGDSVYSFKMPARRVEIQVSFREIPPESLPFTDIADNAWYADAVRYVYENGLMAGTGAQTFSPDATTSRSMIATILWRMAGGPVVNYAMDFADVPQDQWYSEAIRWAVSEGIASGYGNTFGTHDPITREQLAVMLYQFAQARGYDVSVGENTNILSYTDMSDVAEYAIPAMQWACGAGIISGTGDGSTLTPQGQATRAQAAVMLTRFCEEYVTW